MSRPLQEYNSVNGYENEISKLEAVFPVDIRNVIIRGRRLTGSTHWYE